MVTPYHSASSLRIVEEAELILSIVKKRPFEAALGTNNPRQPSNSNSYHCYIVSFWTEDALPCSLHTIAFYTSGGKLYTYNKSGGIVQENGTRQWSNLLSIIENSSRFIVGYEVRPRLNLY